jgi:hypothetical protein
MKAIGRKRWFPLKSERYWYGCLIKSRYLSAEWVCEHQHGTNADARACAKKKLSELQSAGARVQ